jgi:hypothetical protein
MTDPDKLDLYFSLLSSFSTTLILNNHEFLNLETGLKTQSNLYSTTTLGTQKSGRC